MGMMIDEPRCDDAPLRVDHALGGSAGIFADPDDLSALYRDVRGKCRLARAGDDASVLDEQIIRHFFFLLVAPPSFDRSGGRITPSAPCVWWMNDPTLRGEVRQHILPERNSGMR